MEARKHILILRIGALLAVVAIALVSYSGVVATPQTGEQPTPPPAAGAQEYRDPRPAGLALAPDAEPDGNVEMYY